MSEVTLVDVDGNVWDFSIDCRGGRCSISGTEMRLASEGDEFALKACRMYLSIIHCSWSTLQLELITINYN